MLVPILGEGFWIDKELRLFIRNLGPYKQYSTFYQMRYNIYHVIKMLSSQTCNDTLSCFILMLLLRQLFLFMLTTFFQVVVHSYSCALERSFLYHGRMYVSAWHICFHSNVFSKQMKVIIWFFSLSYVLEGIHLLETSHQCLYLYLCVYSFLQFIHDQMCFHDHFIL